MNLELLPVFWLHKEWDISEENSFHTREEHIMNIKPDFLKWINISSIFFDTIKLSVQDQYHGSKRNLTMTDYFTAFLIHCQWTSIPTTPLTSPHALMPHWWCTDETTCQIWGLLSALVRWHLSVFSEILPCLGPHKSNFSWSSYFSDCPSNSAFFYHHSGSNVDHPQGSLLASTLLQMYKLSWDYFL